MRKNVAAPVALALLCLGAACTTSPVATKSDAAGTPAHVAAPTTHPMQDTSPTDSTSAVEGSGGGAFGSGN